ncbi:hypothetical protein [Carboxylicivirga sp. N1Y90]|uniref:hypothetical protein n=1 Tax=Carboxylicivirga fragile TaxID=3417571 RepID=UPI003D32EDB4|nr:TonB-dependent receptor [Marinilabiliaceae bacterium N1Y90]
MGRLLLFILFISFIHQAGAQEQNAFFGSKDSTLLNTSDSILHQLLLPGNQHLLDKAIKPLHFNVEAGTSVSVNFKGGYGTNLYVAPTLFYIPNEKWQFSLRPVIGRSTFHEMPLWIYPNYATTTSGTFNHLGLYAQGTYNINEKLYVGAALRTETIMFEPNNSNTPINNINNIGASTFVGYKFSDHFRVHAEFGISRNQNANFNYIGLPPNSSIIPVKNPYDTF